MRWKGRRQSENVEDRRGSGGGGLGILVIALVVMLLGGNPSALLSDQGQTAPVQEASRDPEAKELVSVILAAIDRQDVAEAIVDDTLQKEAQGYVVPDSFTHGTSKQRMRWFMRGFESGRVQDGDTSTARSL